MIEVIATLQANALLFGLLLVRISAMFATAPVLSSRVVPIRVRAGLAVILALATLPLVADGTLQVPESTVAYVLLAAKEVVVGIAIGLIAQSVGAPAIGQRPILKLVFFPEDTSVLNVSVRNPGRVT